MLCRPSRSILDPKYALKEHLERFCAGYIEAGIATALSARDWAGGASPQVVVAIPAANEEEGLADTLAHLGAAFRCTRRRCALVVFANNCEDPTAALVARATPGLGADVVLLEGSLSDGRAHAGWARRITLDAAALVCAGDGAILTTDADTRVAPDWIEALAEALDDGCDLVCGRIEAEEHPDLLARACALRLIRAEGAYTALQDRVRHYCDQLIGRQPAGGARPHYVEAGASIGMTRTLYRRIGGLPAVPSSEDRALVRAAELAGARILYSTTACVSTSNRLVGRAEGGLAQTLDRRLNDPDPAADQRLRPLPGISGMWASALALARAPHSAAIRHALAENEWLRSMTEPRMMAADLEREIGGLAAFLRDEVEPAFAAWREAFA
jgi:hypothetical protein